MSAVQTLREAPKTPIAALPPLDAAPLRLRVGGLALAVLAASSSDVPRKSVH
jgi:hypothetical protein